MRLCRQLDALIPEEMRDRHKVVIAKGRFGYYAKIVKTGALTPHELWQRRWHRKQLAEYGQLSGKLGLPV